MLRTCLGWLTVPPAEREPGHSTERLDYCAKLLPASVLNLFSGHICLRDLKFKCTLKFKMYFKIIVKNHRLKLLMCSVAKLCLTLSDLLDCGPPGSSVYQILRGKNTGVGSHFLLQGIFPT